MANFWIRNIQTFCIQQSIDGQAVVLYPGLLQMEGKNYLIDCGYMEAFEGESCFILIRIFRDDNIIYIVLLNPHPMKITHQSDAIWTIDN